MHWEMARRFAVEGTPVGCIPFGSGHINETWLLVTNQPHLYILQKVNTGIFPDADGLMRNILLVTAHLRKKDPDPRHVLTLVPTKDGRDYILFRDGLLWRMYEFIPGGISLDQAETPKDFYQSGRAFGLFQKHLSDFPAEKLTEVIPGFHNTRMRYAAFHRAMEEDRLGRVKNVQPEIDFLLAREEGAGLLLDLQQAGDIRLRVTHNDTKLNNVILDEKTREPLCVLDLDTVMPGLAATDFGDSIRFGASTALEDEPDLSKVHLSMELYRAYAEGFLTACGDELNATERETLADGSRIITLEIGMRFLTDYLQGDTYFHIARPEHNLDRARTQFQLVREMEEQDDAIRRMIREI